MKNFRLIAGQLAKIIQGKTLTVPEMHVLVEEIHPGYDPDSLWVSLRTLSKSPNCDMEISRRGEHRAYHLRSVSRSFYTRSAASTGRKCCRSPLPARFNQAEQAYISRANEFDRLLRAARASNQRKTSHEQYHGYSDQNRQSHYAGDCGHIEN